MMSRMTGAKADFLVSKLATLTPFLIQGQADIQHGLCRLVYIGDCLML